MTMQSMAEPYNSHFNYERKPRLPLKSIIYRTYKWKNHKRTLAYFYIPPRLAAEMGFEIGTKVDVLYDNQSLKVKIILLREKKRGWRIRKIKGIPHHKVIKLTIPDGSGLPVQPKNLIINEYEIMAGLNFHLKPGAENEA